MKKKRFEIIYNFLSLEYNIRIIFKYLNIYANISLISLFKSADWLERELWDLYGIFFIFHFNLRRLLTDYGFEYYPMRKDFPLTGYFELFYNEENNILSYESLELMQEYRDFDFISPWYIK